MAGTRATGRESKRRLGRGLSSLMQKPVEIDVKQDVSPEQASADVDQSGGDEAASRLRTIAVGRLSPNPHQPRKGDQLPGIESLAASIRSAGVMQPILVRAKPGGEYEIVAGERRWRAAQMAGLAEVPAIVADLSEEQSAQWAVIENIQREDLDPIEKAEAFAALVNRFGLTHSQIAERVGLDRSSVANLIRLNGLDDSTKSDLRAGRITLGHAKVLLSIQDPNIRRAVTECCLKQEWTVRRLEAEVHEILNPTLNDPAKKSSKSSTPEHVRELEERISSALGVPARIRQNGSRKRGQIVLSFQTVEEFESLLERIESV